MNSLNKQTTALEIMMKIDKKYIATYITAVLTIASIPLLTLAVY